MSWLFSRGQVEDCLLVLSLDGKQSALLNWIGTADAFSSSDKMTDSLEIFSRYGMTFVPLTEDRGAASLILYLEGFLAKHSQPLLQERTMPTIFGLKCGESWQMQLPGTYLPRTYQEKPLTQPQMTLNRWVTKPKRFPLARKTWVATTYGKDIGYLHTPTTQGNYCANSMQKHACCRVWVQVFGKVTPEAQEYLMGWPIGWSALKPLATGGFLSWLSQH